MNNKRGRTAVGSPLAGRVAKSGRTATTVEGLGKWLNNQHSDGLYPNIPQPISTLVLPTKLCNSSNPKFTDKTKTQLGNFDNYSIEFKVNDIERVGNFQIKGFSGKAMVHLKIK